MFFNDPSRSPVSFFDQPADLVIDSDRCRLAVIAMLSNFSTEEDLLILLAEAERTESLIPHSHTIFASHFMARSMSLRAPVVS